MAKVTKKQLLKETVKHIDIKKIDGKKIIDAYRGMSFSSRDTARAADIFNMNLADKNASVWLTLAGSTSAGGCMQVYADIGSAATTPRPIRSPSIRRRTSAASPSA